jgi:hypothetical protein
MRTLEIDLRFDAGAIRIKKATGITDRATLKAMREMLRLLYRQPAHRHLVIEQSRPGCRRSLLDLYTAYLAGKLADLTPSFEDHDLEALKDEWLAEFQASQSHHNTLRGVFKQLLAGVRFKAKLSDLPALLEQYRTKCVANGTPRAFNYAKMGCLALLRDKVGKRHPLRSNVADVPGMPEAKNGVKGMTIEQARSVRAALPEPAARIWWMMCCSGMGPTELWGEWTAQTDRVVIKGTKRPGRRWGSDGRQVPLLCAMTRPAMTVGHFQKLLGKAGATPYQGRKTFTRLMEKAGVPRTRRILYLGHGVKDITFLYEEYEITEFLSGDRARLLAELGPEQTLSLSKTTGLVVAPIAQEA